MAKEKEPETKEEVKVELVEEEIKDEEEKVKVATIREFDLQSWHPKTKLGKDVKEGRHVDIDEIFNKGIKIMEVEIIDSLFPNLESELLLVGQAKGKFGGGKRRVFKQTQKKTKEGNKPKFSTIVVVGNKNGFVGVGSGKSKETVPAREKSLRNAKLNIFKIRRGSGSWESNIKEPHSIPFKVTGKCGSIELTLIPAPRGTGLCVENECQKVLRLAGIKDIWSKTQGHTATKCNLVYACVDALKKLNTIKIKEGMEGVYEGEYKKE